ncbi:MAG: GNAT family N-acetyltransferase [Flavobacteriales bacterium]|nr:GNAT family N-acetyltransferase [Flavobacteriales bacterium]
MEYRLLEFGSPEQIDSVRLREAVLRVPLGMSFTQEELQAEADELHVAALDKAGKILGILLLKPVDGTTLKMRQVAVRPDLQGKGIGKGLVLFAEELCRSRGINRITLHAREPVVPFYEALGYGVDSGPFQEVGIPHFAMSRKLLSEEQAHRVSDQ